jgi:HPt (histidine-containing phosphotransfer) domain-containing protein
MLETDPQRHVLNDRLRELTKRFLDRVPERLVAIEDSVSRAAAGMASLEEVGRHFHSLAGTAGTYRAYDIAQLAADAEAFCISLESIDRDAEAHLHSVLHGIREAMSSRGTQNDEGAGAATEVVSPACSADEEPHEDIDRSTVR